MFRQSKFGIYLFIFLLGLKIYYLHCKSEVTLPTKNHVTTIRSQWRVFINESKIYFICSLLDTRFIIGIKFWIHLNWNLIIWITKNSKLIGCICRSKSFATINVCALCFLFRKICIVLMQNEIIYVTSYLPEILENNHLCPIK